AKKRRHVLQIDRPRHRGGKDPESAGEEAPDHRDHRGKRATLDVEPDNGRNRVAASVASPLWGVRGTAIVQLSAGRPRRPQGRGYKGQPAAEKKLTSYSQWPKNPSRKHLTITSYNICHIKSRGSGSDALWFF